METQKSWETESFIDNNTGWIDSRPLQRARTFRLAFWICSLSGHVISLTSLLVHLGYILCLHNQNTTVLSIIICHW